MPDFVWNAKTRKYQVGRRTISPARLRDLVEETLESAKSTMASIARRYNGGFINRPQFIIEMREEISRAHSAMTMLANGGKQAMNESAWGRAGQKIRGELDYLRGFERDLANERAGSLLEIQARAEQYSNGLWSTYQNAVQAREKSSGVRQIERVLDSGALHCNDCPSLAGIYDIDTAPPLGASECQGNCRCYFQEVEAVAA